MSTAAQRVNLSADDYGDPEGRRFPVVDQEDVRAAEKAHPKIRARVAEIARRKKLAAPAAWSAVGMDDLMSGKQSMSDDGTMAFVTDLTGLQFGDDATEAVRIEICRDGRWKHGKYGKVEVTPEVRRSFKDNFDANVRRVGELPIDYDHQSGPAAAWITGITNEAHSTFADVKFTSSGREKIRAGEYRFYSPEWSFDWKDPQSGERHGPTLFGGGLTNKPFFKGMQAINCFSDPEDEDDAATLSQKRKLTMVEAEEGMKVAVDDAVSQRFAEWEAKMKANDAKMVANEERMQAVEMQNTELRSLAHRREVEDQVVSLKFSDDAQVKLAPAARGELIDWLVTLTAEQQAKGLEVIQGFTFADLQERGHTGSDPNGSGDGDAGALTASEESNLKEMAERNGLKFEEVKASFLQVKAERKAATKKG